MLSLVVRSTRLAPTSFAADRSKLDTSELIVLRPTSFSRSLSTTSARNGATSPLTELKRESATVSPQDAKKNEAKAEQKKKSGSETSPTKANKAATTTKYGTTDKKTTIGSPEDGQSKKTQ
ncbi:BQ2448_2480 [Microbotryum intermedium]|uniref:BQ2448_2480 protein n=1 Tax=Microbotryum intermedium TaxID=269621 RepID=A0A238F6G5_9BASI|nr:BQ2448_2480 [Microbotryum intermedium]